MSATFDSSHMVNSGKWCLQYKQAERMLAAKKGETIVGHEKTREVDEIILSGKHICLCDG